MKHTKKIIYVSFIVVLLIFCAKLFLPGNTYIENSKEIETIQIKHPAFEENNQELDKNKIGIPVEKNPVKKETVPGKEITPDKSTENITIITGEKTTNIAVPQNTTFFNALTEIQRTGTLVFSGKQYPGLGFFVTDIGPLHSGNGKNLIYYVNGKEADVGVSTYILKNGDIIEWKLE